MSTSEHDQAANQSPAPALAQQALNLLDLEVAREQTAQRSGTWNTGVKGLDATLPPDLWSSGKIIGIGSVDGSPSLSAQILATHLLSLPLPPLAAPGEAVTVPESNPVSAFIIAPHGTSFISTLYDTLLQAFSSTSSSPAQSPSTRALELLTSVRLLQHLDFAGLVESLDEVSSHLRQSSDSNETSTLSSLDRTGRMTCTTTNRVPNKTILLITDLSSTLTNLSLRFRHHQHQFSPQNTNREPNTNAIQPNALLSSLLRSLTHLSRNQPSLLVLLDLSLSSTTSISISVSVSSSTHTHADILPQPQTQNQNQNQNHDQIPSHFTAPPPFVVPSPPSTITTLRLTSCFSPFSPSVSSSSSRSTTTATPTPTTIFLDIPTPTLRTTLEQIGLDVVVFVHEPRVTTRNGVQQQQLQQRGRLGQRDRQIWVVEVVKDRGGGGGGKGDRSDGRREDERASAKASANANTNANINAMGRWAVWETR